MPRDGTFRSAIRLEIDDSVFGESFQIATNSGLVSVERPNESANRVEYRPSVLHASGVLV
ncbi:hypothetical protein BRC64_04750 [Halobacteriales archaeon QH_10_67_22]|nr:MAG: hypothetical protein BRC64_04750 [Halobacteriales archaeon QH_10_67_22]